MKKPHPIQFRAVHSKNRWRKADHESEKNALTGTRGARALFDRLNKAINYAREGDAKFVIIWREGEDKGEIVVPDHDQWDGLRHAPMGIDDINRFERDGPPSDEVLWSYFGRSPVTERRSEVAESAQEPAEPIFAPTQLAEVEQDLQRRIADSQNLSAADRLARLAASEPLPRRVCVDTTAFIRNADVIVEVLLRANGRCEGCSKPAPFIRASNRTPYLEVHHQTPLSQGGEDTVNNALALCPNCHRFRHYGAA
ncbi:HNH endonuclease signature motif containing protein [Caenimonas sp. SL110]|uniref:HNH endonuclease n=1 Tax=Caenimonas sp. SL110 TaxID=1450524 RepID=UPI0009E3295F|nr:HNH endonuclease signature motif containing protein [Caenimonas sp. SL110]